MLLCGERLYKLCFPPRYLSKYSELVYLVNLPVQSTMYHFDLTRTETMSVHFLQGQFLPFNFQLFLFGKSYTLSHTFLKANFILFCTQSLTSLSCNCFGRKRRILFLGSHNKEDYRKVTGIQLKMYFVIESIRQTLLMSIQIIQKVRRK